MMRNCPHCNSKPEMLKWCRKPRRSRHGCHGRPRIGGYDLQSALHEIRRSSERANVRLRRALLVQISTRSLRSSHRAIRRTSFSVGTASAHQVHLLFRLAIAVWSSGLDIPHIDRARYVAFEHFEILLAGEWLFITYIPSGSTVRM